MPDDVIQSPDTQRAERLPPGQVKTVKWPPLLTASVPPFDAAAWDFALFPKPLVSAVKRFTWAEFCALPRVKVFADMHSEERWSKLDNLWEGVATRELLQHVTLSADARFAMIHCEYGVTVNLPLADFFDGDCLFALKHDGQLLAAEQGGPLRLVIPKLYAWKSAPWVRGVEFMAEDRPGFRESPEHGGYHLHGDPWKEERFQEHQS